MQYAPYSPSPSPAPGSGGDGYPSQNGGPATPARFNLINKLHNTQNFHQSPHHHPNQHSFSYQQQGSASPAYNGSSQHAHHQNSIAPQQSHQPQQLQHGPPGHGFGGPTNGQANAGPISAHWQQQLNLSSLSRAAHSPHHHARAAHLAARGQATSAIQITDPRQSQLVNGHRKEESLSAASRTGSQASLRAPTPSAKDPKDLSGGSPTAASAGLGDAGATADGKATWTTIDMGGMNLKNISPELFRYTFLTTLYIPHNNLTQLPPILSKLTHLTLLDASSNKLTALPLELGLITSLKELLVFDNHLSTIPPELGTLYQLETLGIEGNPLPDNMRHLIEKDGTPALISYLRDSCPVPMPPPERPWLAVDYDRPPPSAKPEEAFTVGSYNILCEKYATAQMYGYTPSWALGWDYRKELIMQEILTFNADILCLQEVAVEQYETFFLDQLADNGYDGVYYPKSRARTMSGEEKKMVDGCAIFYKSATFALVEQHMIEFNQIAMRRTDFKKTEDMFNRVMTKDNIAVVCLLEHRNSGARLIVANNHVTANPEFRDVKLVQVAMLMDELGKIGNDFAKLPARLHLGEGHDKAPNYRNGSEIPTLVCGDFNSGPESGVYEFLTQGTVDKAHEDFMDHVYGNYTAEGLSHRLTLKSSYSHIGELPFTNYTPGFQGVLDYLFYTSNALCVRGLMGPIDHDYVHRNVGFPNAHQPSDHVAIVGEFQFKL